MSHTYRKIGERHEHRIVAERMLGRPLKPGEVVHHVNGDSLDNRPENLQVLPSQAEHARLHTKNRRCELDDCDRKHYANGLCSVHYQRQSRGVPLDGRPARLCDVPGCGGKHHGNGLCNRHYLRVVRAVA